MEQICFLVTSALWNLKCLRRYSFTANILPQVGHFKSFSFLCLVGRYLILPWDFTEVRTHSDPLPLLSDFYGERCRIRTQDCCLTQPGPTSLKNVKCKIYVKSLQKCQNRTIISNDLKLETLHRLLPTMQCFITVEGIEKKTINSRNQNENEIIHTQ